MLELKAAEEQAYRIRQAALLEEKMQQLLPQEEYKSIIDKFKNWIIGEGWC